MCQFYNILHVLMDFFVVAEPYFLFADPHVSAERHFGNNRLDQGSSNCGTLTTNSDQESFVGTRT